MLEKSVAKDSNFKTFKEFLLSFIKANEVYYNLLKKNLLDNSSKNNLLTDSAWVGKRLNVDLLSENLNSNLHKKNISVELLNNNYLWFDKYNPYLKNRMCVSLSGLYKESC